MKKTKSFIALILCMALPAFASCTDNTQNIDSDVTKPIITERESQYGSASGDLRNDPDHNENNNTSGTQCIDSANWEAQGDTTTVSESTEEEFSPYNGDGEMITLNGNAIVYAGNGATVNGSTITVNKPGTYIISGQLDDGQIIVELTKEEQAVLILYGADISCSYSAPIYIKSADKVTVHLYPSTLNSLTDTGEYKYATDAENEPNATLFSKDDLTIKGSGTLEINANYNNGITSKNDLKIKTGTITINAKNDGIRGKDSVEIGGGKISIVSNGDGIKTTSEEEDKGYIVINGGNIDISTSGDGIQAQNYCTVSSGNITVKTNAISDQDSSKGIKAEKALNLNGGNIIIDSSDDSLHSNGAVIIGGGSFSLSTGDDGIHADSEVKIENGTINITKSYEGIEGQTINVSGGTIQIMASDDGINCADGTGDSFGGMGGFGGMGRPGGMGRQDSMQSSSSNCKLTITGGRIYVNASGDGLDSNGDIEMSGGTVIVDGPTNNGNGPLDYDNTFVISGGTLIAAGSMGMAQNVSSTSTQNTVMCYVSGSAGTLFNISDKSGNSVITYKPSKSYQCVLVSSSSLQSNAEYTVSVGGTCSGNSVNGLFSGGTYSGGTSSVSYTHSKTVMTAGNAGGMGGMGGGRPGSRR